MPSSFFLPIFLTIIHSLIPFTSSSCPPQKFTCGQRTLDIEFPFFTSQSSNQCSGLHYIQCINQVPAVHFRGLGYLYPITDISYTDKAIIIHDINLSAYYRRSNCIFLYDFEFPVPNFAFTSFSISLQSGESFFNCKEDYDFSSDIFILNNNLSLCKDYIIHYSGDFRDPRVADLPAHCIKYSNPGFHWKLSFGGGKDGGETALMAAGFSPEWTKRRDCFSCEFAASGNCSGVAGDSSCRCRSSCQGEKKDNSGIIIGVSIATGILFISILCFIGFWWHLRLQQKRQCSSSSTLLSYHSSITGSLISNKASDLTDYPYQTQVFTYEELHEATNAFDTAMEIGDGGFGAVYKGTLRDGRTVAVKRLYEKFNRAEQFANEIVILSRLRHQNLVSLYGCTSSRSCEFLLVYEFVSNGTVADHLHGARATEGHLTWPRRLSIAVETANALGYLHAVDPPIVHRDIKTENILLDAEYHVKIADFGLSRLFPRDGASHISTAPQGTPGYLDPDYHHSYQLTDRSDVYSFGVVLAELLSSKPAVDICRERSEINLSTLAVNRIQSGNLDDLVDRQLGYDSDVEMRKKMSLVAELAFRCLEADREMRPAIKEVLEVLIELQNGELLGSQPSGHFVGHVVANVAVDKGDDELPVSPVALRRNG